MPSDHLDDFGSTTCKVADVFPLKVPEDPLELFYRSVVYLSDKGYGSEIDHVRDLTLSYLDPELSILSICLGGPQFRMKEQVASEIYHRFIDSDFDPAIVKHLGKRAAIKFVKKNVETIYKELMASDDRISYLYNGRLTRAHNQIPSSQEYRHRLRQTG